MIEVFFSSFIFKISTLAGLKLTPSIVIPFLNGSKSSSFAKPLQVAIYVLLTSLDGCVYKFVNLPSFVKIRAPVVSKSSLPTG